MNEDDPDLGQDELREAEALAHALERGSATDDLPDEAFQTAALIRYGAGGGALREDREDAVLEEVLAAADRARDRRGTERSTPWWHWLFGAAGLAAAAALVVLIVTSPGQPAPTALPAPDPRLIEAQLARLEGSEADPRFDEAMRGYRGEVYAALEARYGAR